MTLTIKLDLDTVQFDLHVKFLVKQFSCESAQAHTDTHTQTGQILFNTSTADAGGNEKQKKGDTSKVRSHFPEIVRLRLAKTVPS